MGFAENQVNFDEPPKIKKNGIRGKSRVPEDQNLAVRPANFFSFVMFTIFKKIESFLNFVTEISGIFEKKQIFISNKTQRRV